MGGHRAFEPFDRAGMAVARVHQQRMHLQPLLRAGLALGQQACPHAAQLAEVLGEAHAVDRGGRHRVEGVRLGVERPAVRVTRLRQQLQEAVDQRGVARERRAGVDAGLAHLAGQRLPLCRQRLPGRPQRAAHQLPGSIQAGLDLGFLGVACRRGFFVAGQRGVGQAAMLLRRAQHLVERGHHRDAGLLVGGEVQVALRGAQVEQEGQGGRDAGQQAQQRELA